jgi:hypothetical protein
MNEPESPKIAGTVPRRLKKKKGDERWTQHTARRLGLQFTLNPRGRPFQRPARATEPWKW